MRRNCLKMLLIFAVFAEQAFTAAASETAPRPMTGERMQSIIKRVDADANAQGNVVEFDFDGTPLVLVYDAAADRMRLMSPVVKVDELKDGQLKRMMQANFDSALDARYAIANEVVWSVFIHPLSSLSEEQFITAIGQTINVVATFGTSYNSGVFVYGGGDSSELERREVIDRLREFIGT
ncbi:MAG: type III secretion system chaperone [Pseudomonadota bacterium]